MHRRILTKTDGRQLHLYARDREPFGRCAPSPAVARAPLNSHLRWHPLRGEWVAYAGHRQHRTFLPPPEYNPLAASCDSEFATEVPDGDWDPPDLGVATAEGRGVCEVVVFTQDSTASLGTLPLPHIALLIDVWADRYCALSARPDVQYVYPFENRGREMGVTLHHPHGQIYGYPFVPPVPARELAEQRRYLDQHGRGLLADFIAREASDRMRMLYQGDHVAAFMPICARYSYEVWIAPYRGAPSIAGLTRDERLDFARALKTVLLKFDGLWQAPFPYVMAIHQAPTDGQSHPEAHVHAEFYPAYRMAGRLKYLAGSELGAGVFTADTVPEEKVKELQAVTIDIHG
jgi:UDPglucose--hexose-1-phosphate uridylyltransferase